MKMNLLTPEGTHITEEVRPVLQSISDIQKELEAKYPVIRTMSRNALKGFSDLDPQQTAVFDQLYAIDPTKFGINVPIEGDDVDLTKLVTVRNQQIVRNGVTETVGDRYTTPDAFRAFAEMSSDMARKIGRHLVIQTAYRSPAYQALLVARAITQNDFDLAATLAQITVPGYSQHADIEALAHDVMPFDANKGYRFEDMPEYEWMTENAAKYDFYLTYPQDNEAHMIFEPWHWQHIPK